jgi:enoyl-CoA hydratase/carnithine racemase
VKTIRVERDGPTLRVTLARPERRNAFDETMIAELTEAFASVGDARVVVLAGEGPAFSAGADADWMRRAAGLSEQENLRDARRAAAMLETIDRCPAAVVALVRGPALGGGSGLVACADVALATEDAVFGFTEVKLGLIPATISPYVVRRIGAGAARRLFVTGERFGAHTALAIGLVHELVDDLEAAGERLVGEILAGAPGAIREAKALVRDAPLTAEETARRIAERRASHEAQEGLRAFLEKRGPPWRSAGSS